MPKRFRAAPEDGDRVWKDQTEAIRSKYQSNHIRGRLLTKCPTCHGNFSEEDFREHRPQCPPRIAKTPKPSPPALQPPQTTIDTASTQPQRKPSQTELNYAAFRAAWIAKQSPAVPDESASSEPGTSKH